jgi:hypothetical protein
MKIIVMLIWIGGSHGGPATITGFDSMKSCNDQKPIVFASYKIMLQSPAYGLPSVSETCIELNK